jgi:hypothetical protein
MPPATARQEPVGAEHARPPGSAGAALLADRIAATLVRHQPGWLVPRPTQLARRHEVSTDEIRAAVDHLIARGLIRRTPDGRLYRASPAEYLISLEGIAGLGGSVDPMGGSLTCLDCKAGRERAPQDAACALDIPVGEPVGVIRLAWALDGAPAALSTTYLARVAAEPRVLAGWLAAATPPGELPLSPATADGAHDHDSRPACPPRAVAVQMQQPAASVARRLRLRTGQMAVLVTVLSGFRGGRGPATLTAAVLRPDMFRVTVQSAPSAPSGGFLPAAWSLAARDDRW